MYLVQKLCLFSKKTQNWFAAVFSVAEGNSTTMTPVLFLQSPKRPKTCIASKHKLILGVSVDGRETLPVFLEYQITSSPFAVHVRATAGTCGDCGRISPEREGGDCSGRSQLLASTLLWASFTLNSNGGSVPDLVLHRIYWGTWK